MNKDFINCGYLILNCNKGKETNVDNEKSVKANSLDSVFSKFLLQKMRKPLRNSECKSNEVKQINNNEVNSSHLFLEQKKEKIAYEILNLHKTKKKQIEVKSIEGSFDNFKTNFDKNKIYFEKLNSKLQDKDTLSLIKTNDFGLKNELKKSKKLLILLDDNTKLLNKKRALDSYSSISNSKLDLFDTERSTTISADDISICSNSTNGFNFNELFKSKNISNKKKGLLNSLKQQQIENSPQLESLQLKETNFDKNAEKIENLKNFLRKSLIPFSINYYNNNSFSLNFDLNSKKDLNLNFNLKIDYTTNKIFNYQKVKKQTNTILIQIDNESECNESLIDNELNNIKNLISAFN